MPKSRKRKAKGSRSRPRASSSLAEHRRRGGKLVPPLATLSNLTPVAWLPDVLPDMLWLCSLIVEDDLDGMRAANAALKLIDEAIRETTGGDLLPLPVDGRLTRLEGVPEEARARAIELLMEKDGYELAVPEDVAHALAMYPGAPGTWLIQPWLDRGITVDWERAQAFLGKVIDAAAHGQSLPATRAKFVALARWAASGKLHVPRDSTFELLPRYPHDLTDDEMKLVESSTRATFGALLMADEHQPSSEGSDREQASNSRVDWARRFWRSNWSIFPCRPLEDSTVSGDPGDIDALASLLRQETTALQERFIAVASTTDPDLYDPDRYEVLTGLVSAAIRSVWAAAMSPASWSAEHGLMVNRSVVEALITVRWLLHKNEPEMYRRFKEYGRGHLKLLKLHVEEYIDDQADPPEDLRRFAKYLETEVNADVGEEWQEIQLGGTFAGISTRDMADAVGMRSEYNFVFAPASSSTHREWVTLDRYALTRCMNPLHRWHRIPRASLSTTIGPEVMESALGLAEELIEVYLSAFGPPAQAEPKAAAGLPPESADASQSQEDEPR